jgi:hypothetical protein
MPLSPVSAPCPGNDATGVVSPVSPSMKWKSMVTSQSHIWDPLPVM